MEDKCLIQPLKSDYLEAYKLIEEEIAYTRKLWFLHSFSKKIVHFMSKLSLTHFGLIKVIIRVNWSIPSYK